MAEQLRVGGRVALVEVWEEDIIPEPCSHDLQGLVGLARHQGLAVAFRVVLVEEEDSADEEEDLEEDSEGTEMVGFAEAEVGMEEEEEEEVAVASVISPMASAVEHPQKAPLQVREEDVADMEGLAATAAGGGLPTTMAPTALATVAVPATGVAMVATEEVIAIVIVIVKVGMATETTLGPENAAMKGTTRTQENEGIDICTKMASRPTRPCMRVCVRLSTYTPVHRGIVGRHGHIFRT